MAKSKQVSILVDEIDLAEIDGWAKLAGRSRNWTVGMILANWVGSATEAKEQMLGIVPQKKIADISEGGGIEDFGNISAELQELHLEMARNAGAPPDLSPLGKAQDGDLTEMRLLKNSARDVNGPFIYGRPGENSNAPGSEVVWPFRRALVDGVPCGHAGCLSHLSHPCEGCGRFGGRRPIYNMEDNTAAGREQFLVSAQEMKKIAEEDGDGFSTISPETLDAIKDRAKIDVEMAKVLHTAGVELDREILVRWGLAENYKPITFENQRGVPGSEVVVNRTQVRSLVDKNKSEDEVGGGKDVEESQGGESGASAGKNRRVAKGLPKNDDGGKSAAVGVGKPKIDMATLRDICEGKFPDLVGKTLTKEEVDAPDFGEIDICGFKSYNEIDGENYVSGKEVHGPKVKHGSWCKM